MNKKIDFYFLNFTNKIKEYFNSGSNRNAEIKKHILLSFGNRGLSILINLLLVPLVIHFVNPTQYGIWLTISSIIQWISYFDFGFAHGFRNKFAEAMAKNDIVLAKQYVSTTYAVLITIFSFFFVAISIVNYFLDWSSLLNVSIQYKDELSTIVFILVFFICIQLVANIFSILLLADQKPAFSSFIATLGQLITLLIIFVLTKKATGNLLTLSIVASSIPALTVLLISIYMFKTKYKNVSPSIKNVKFNLIKNIIGLGSKFFIIQLCMLFTLQFSNIILTRIQGPLAVTEYNIAYKYFSILYLVFVVIFTPFWSAFTDAYTKKDYVWMQNAYNKLMRIALFSIPLTFIMILIAPTIYKLWIGESNIKISFYLSFLMGIYTILLVFGNFFMSLINGTGKILLQTIIYVFFAIVSIPLLNIFCEKFGTPGVVLVPIIVFFVQNILGFIQLKKILHNPSLSGIWSK